MKCISGKNGYYLESEAEEALIRSQINAYRSAINYYQCFECNEYHLTSQGSRHPLLDDPEVKKRIAKERLEQEWNQRLRR